MLQAAGCGEPYLGAPVHDLLAERAEDLLGALGRMADEAVLDFDDPRRTSWTYLPGPRPGVALAEMHRSAAVAVERLVGALLMPTFHARTTAIRGLEDPLDLREGGRGRRHLGDYWVALFGEPGQDAWGWRLGGHHLSISVTVVGSQLRATPFFLGANPARMAVRGVMTSQPLAPEEQLGFALLGALSPDQRDRAVVASDAPGDILTRDRSQVEPPEPEGLRLGELEGPARAQAERLVGTYLDRVRPEVAAELPRVDVEDVWFAWRGADQPGVGHYYRLAAPRFLVELDDTQDRANHAHSVWRDPAGDFGRDLLSQR